MKRLIAALILIITVFGLATTSSIMINRYYKTLTSEITAAEQLLNKGESAEHQLSRIKTTWEKVKPALMFFANHDSVEDIGVNIERLIVMGKDPNSSEFFAETAELKTKLSYLKDNESLSFESVF